LEVGNQVVNNLLLCLCLLLDRLHCLPLLSARFALENDLLCLDKVTLAVRAALARG
jgi:hypothetical protein